MSTFTATGELHPNVFPGLPLGFVRSALFGVSELPHESNRNLSREAARHDAIELAAPKAYHVHYRGPSLNQHHAIVWQAIIEAHRKRCGSDPMQVLRISRPDLLRAIGRKDVGTGARKQLGKWIEDLTRAWVSVDTPKIRYQGALISAALLDKETHQLCISIPGLLDLFTNEVAGIDLQRKLLLGRNQIALWLHDYISSQSNDPQRMIPVPVSELHRLSGTSLAKPQFRQRLKQAIDLLKDNKVCTTPLLISATIDASDRLVFQKSRTFTLILGGNAKNRVLATNARDQRVQQVLESRGRVAL